MMQDEPWWHETENQQNDSSSPLGSGPEEAAQLFSAIRDRVLSDPAAMKAGIQVMELLSSFRGAMDSPAAPGDAPECAYCPVCQAISRAQNISPESVESVTAAAIKFAESLRQALGDGDQAAPDEGVRHVPLDDDDDDQVPE
jgi:hypothetical protein